MKGGTNFLWVRALDSLVAQLLSGTDGASYPFWSPDNRAIAFFAHGKLKTIELSTGHCQTLADAPQGVGGTWNRNGEIVFVPNLRSGLYRVRASGGVATPATTLELSQPVAHRWPHFFPDGRHFAYLVPEPNRIFIGSLDSGDQKFLCHADSGVGYAPPGYLLFMRGSTLFAQPFHANKFELTGEAIPVAEQVGYDATYFRGDFSVSEGGVLAYRSGGFLNTQPIWFNRAGKQLGAIGARGNYLNLSMLPDQKQVAAARIDADTSRRDIWLIDLVRGITSRFTFGPLNNWLPLWSPDGSRIVFTSSREGGQGLYEKLLSGTGREEVLLKSATTIYPTDWAPDRRVLLYDSTDPKTKSDLWVLPLFGDRKPIPFLQTPFNEVHGQFSPNGRWIAYGSDESGNQEVYVQPFPAAGAKLQISIEGGVQPKWSQDGKELFYTTMDRKLMAVKVNSNSSKFEAGVPEALFQTRIPDLTNARNRYVVSRDGQRFLINTVVEGAGTAPITVVLNWTAGLKR